MSDSDIIDAIGGTSAVAAIFQITSASVSGWRERGIPKARRQTLALMFPDKVPPDWRPHVPAREGKAA
jgi:hypothetical protein